ncbi:MAG TPA: hypothetical protein VJB98_02065 [Candidatus Paceibacterota bacterium]
MSKETKNILKGVVIGGVLMISATVMAAWSEPTQAPTGGNPEAPINVSNASQTKGGNLVVNSNNQSLNGLLVPFGNVVVGDMSPEAALKLDVEGKAGATQFCNDSGTQCFTVATLCLKVNQLCN